MSKGKLLAMCIVWLMVAGTASVAWRYVVVGGKEQAQQSEQEAILNQTKGTSQYDIDVKFGIDQFSGYAVLRSPEFRKRLQREKIEVSFIDDGADYTQRLQNLQTGSINMAVFTIDALIKASATIGDTPAVIVSIIDETRGADAIVANKASVPNVEAMNHPDTRFVLTPDSPSETLARVVMNDFSLDQLADHPFEMTRGPEDTLERYRQSQPNSRDVFVLWEPYVSKVLENPEMHVVIDSSRFRGRIVDVIVTSRDFLAKNRSVVEDVVGSYFAAAYSYREQMQTLIKNDAKQQKSPLTDAQAKKLTAGIRWKNTQENFAHFGLRTDNNLQHIEDMISNITDVLMQTGGIQIDPTKDQPNELYYERVLANLKESNFHPGLTSEKISDDKILLPALSATEWSKLREVGELNVGKLIFPRGSSRLTDTSGTVLDDLVNTLNSWPQYYLLVRGNASMRGDFDANKRLATNRAEAAADYLVQQGIDKNRIKAAGGDPTGSTSVSFVLGEAPY
ncbi:MAG: OmpA family protein [Planctomycetaceae bacterium]|nr:OmpA family protein [Planctomycetaceae bacterium]